MLYTVTVYSGWSSHVSRTSAVNPGNRERAMTDYRSPSPSSFLHFPNRQPDHRTMIIR